MNVTKLSLGGFQDRLMRSGQIILDYTACSLNFGVPAGFSLNVSLY